VGQNRTTCAVVGRLLAGLLVLLAAGCVTTNEDGAIIAKNKPDYAEAARINAQLGVDYLRNGHEDLALEKLNKALEQDPSLAEAHSAIAVLYSRRGENEVAEKEYRKALSLSPRDPSIKNNFGAFLCANGKYSEAERYFVDAAADRSYGAPESALTNAGICARRDNDLPGAEKYLREALKIKPDFPDALGQMAWVSLQNKDYLRARAFMQRYESVGKASPETLWVAGRTEAALGNQAAAQAYQRRLETEFPTAAETRRTVYQ